MITHTLISKKSRFSNSQNEDNPLSADAMGVSATMTGERWQQEIIVDCAD